MATFADKRLGKRLQNYCSSSSDEENEENINAQISPDCKQTIGEWDGTSVNTGPKGVLKDWQRFKQLESERKEEQDSEKLKLMEKLSLTCISQIEDEKNNEEDELLNDDLLRDYIQKRMEEMMTKFSNLPVFGRVHHLNSANDFFDAVYKEHENVTVIIHFYEDNNSCCEAMNGCLTRLSEEYPQVKFCKVEAPIARLSIHFKMNGIPALLIYKSGQLMAHFAKVGNELRDDFYASDVEEFLVEHGLLPDKTLIPSLIRDAKTN